MQTANIVSLNGEFDSHEQEVREAGFGWKGHRFETLDLLGRLCGRQPPHSTFTADVPLGKALIP